MFTKCNKTFSPSKFEDLWNSSRLHELVTKKEPAEKKKNTLMIALAVIGAIAAVAGIAYCVYKCMRPDYLEDFEDDCDDDCDCGCESEEEKCCCCKDEEEKAE